MQKRGIFDIPGNRENIKDLIARKDSLIPFIGAGFSAPACPLWGLFLENFFQNIKEEFLLPEEENHYLQLKEKNHFENMAGFLVEKSERRKFEEAMIEQFDRPLLPEMTKKFLLLHRVFPGLKITTNFDCLLENSSPGSHVKTCYGDQPEELEKYFTKWDQNVLLKIHGGLRDIHSIVLSLSQYKTIYGDPVGFDPEAPLPRFLTRVFTNASVLFIGCSLAQDRTIKIMESLPEMRPHFAIICRPKDKKKLVPLNRRLARLYITPIWITDFSQIEEILHRLVETGTIPVKEPSIEHGALFVGREGELNQIKENAAASGGKGSVQMITGQLFSIEGAGGVGKTTLAIEAAKRFSSLFKDGVLAPIRVNEHSPMSFAVYLAGRFNLKVEEPADAVSARALVTRILKERHVLLILDNAVKWQNLRYMLPTETCATILVTTRSREMYHHLRLECPGLRVHEISLKKFTPQEALALFERMLGKSYKAGEEDIYLRIAENLDFLPIALRQAISLMLFGPHYTASTLLAKLMSEDRLALLQKGKAAEESDSLTIESIFDLSSPLLTPDLIETLEYLAVCSAGPVPLDFLQRLAKDEEIGERLERLFAFSWCERRERDEERSYELHQLVREVVQRKYGSHFREDFIQLVHDIFLDESVHFSSKEELFLQLEEAFLLAKEVKDKRLKDWAYGLYYFCTYRGFGDFYIRLAQSVEELFPEDKWALRPVYNYQALILRGWGKLDEAMAFCKKHENICLELGDRYELAKSYGNQAVILKAWGKLDEAMTLHKKQEEIAKGLDNREQLALSICGQALIFKRRGKLDEAMTLHKKEEEIFNQLGDRARLAKSYGNQALILYALRKFDEAMTLYKKEEKICIEKGNREQLAQSICGQALILKEWGKLDEAMSLHKKEEEIAKELGSREQLALSYGYQALILSDWGKLDEAMTLHKKEEEIAKELGNREQLARSWWNQGLIYNKKKDYHNQIQLWRKSIEMNKAIGIPTKEDEEALEKLTEG